MPIKTIFLDAGGVLVNPNWHRVSDLLRRHGVETSPALLRNAEPHIKFALDNEEVVQATNDQDRFITYLEMIFERAGCARVPPAALRELHEYQSAFNLWESVDADVYSTLDELRKRGYKLIVLSNSNGTLRKAFARLGLAEKFDLLFDSHEHGVEKPDIAFFELALRESKSLASETVHVGDFYHIDVAGAQSAGLSAVLFDSGRLYQGFDCARITSLPELIPLMERL